LFQRQPKSLLCDTPTAVQEKKERVLKES